MILDLLCVNLIVTVAFIFDVCLDCNWVQYVQNYDKNWIIGNPLPKPLLVKIFATENCIFQECGVEILNCIQGYLERVYPEELVFSPQTNNKLEEIFSHQQTIGEETENEGVQWYAKKLEVNHSATTCYGYNRTIVKANRILLRKGFKNGIQGELSDKKIV